MGTASCFHNGNTTTCSSSGWRLMSKQLVSISRAFSDTERYEKKKSDGLSHTYTGIRKGGGFLISILDAL